MTKTAPERIFVKGNEAVAHGALAAGCRCFFGYPITPQNEIPEFMSKALPEAGGEFVQAESEVAAANMLLGAAACGIRAMTSSSSPGISLKQEAISYMAGSQLPAVLVNMSRGGPGLGDIGPSQGDYYQSTRGGGHGDYRLLVIAPATCQEAYDLIIEAFDLAFKYKNPVMILGDAILGQMKEPVTCWKPEGHNDHAESWQLDGCKGRDPRLIKSLFLEEGALAEHNLVLQAKYEAMKAEVRYETFECDDAELVVVAFGSIGRIVKSTVRSLRARGHKVGLFRPITLYPFPSEALAELAAQGKRFLTIEHNLGQMVDDVRLAVRKHGDSDFHAQMPGTLPNPDDFEKPILERLGGK
ncbi:2-oxoglutarate ferredoxin oxidoreductase subunit alpha [Desulfobaculum xiamenense]|uniref:2-oxoglutarate ferredoxin oxidoreductase subunit alpha n=1 Tax=Desulfobaculum xiamenense TaxID=995050 RepID=A0A846QNW6_9BACT|nr:3-methyl-2-oxobutanoate dehydrogenase subunit VorB [Desulfobaculum xiamenense]NJB67973.1 2-oxoglutarate ferredoxin oxidoreductase subunit alpha [Desulfobaculum xiamenense]